MRSVLKLAMALWGIGASAVHADATLVYHLTEPGAEPVEKKFSIARFFVRVDDPSEKEGYLLYQAGKFFPLYRVNESQQTYTLLTPEVKATLRAGSTQTKTNVENTETQMDPATPEAVDTPKASESTQQPAPDNAATETKKAEQPVADKADDNKTGSPPPALATKEPGPANTEPVALPSAPSLKPTRKTGSVAGIECRIVLELIDGKPVAEHCMANNARLGITERESRTLARLFLMARKKGFDWLGATTADEDFVSVQSRDLRRNKTLELNSVSTAPLPSGYLRIPRSFKKTEVSVEAKRDTESDPPSGNAPQPTPGQAQ